MTVKNSPLDLDHAAIDDLVAIGSALREAASYNDLNDTPLVLVPPGWTAQLHPELRTRPPRPVGTVVLQTLTAYIAFVSDYATPESRTFVDLTAGRCVTVFDFHQREEDVVFAFWCGFRAEYPAPRTPEFNDWHAKSGHIMTQDDFAAFIEDHLPDIVDPPAAEMAEIARSLHANISVTFSKATRLDNGETQLQYVEEIGASAGVKGQLKIPQTIKLGLPLFVGSEAYALEARFKYRIKDGQLTLWYELIRPERLIADALQTMAARVAEQTDPPVYFGVAPGTPA